MESINGAGGMDDRHERDGKAVGSALRYADGIECSVSAADP